MGMQNADNYLRIHDSCIRLHAIIMDAKTSVQDLVSAVKMLIEAEAYKREMRGIPRLKSIGLNEVQLRHARRPRRIPTITDAPKESLSKDRPSPPDP